MSRDREREIRHGERQGLRERKGTQEVSAAFASSVERPVVFIIRKRRALSRRK